MTEITLYGPPRTKKNSQRIIQVAGHPRIVPSTDYKRYERDCLRQIRREHRKSIEEPVNVRCLYFMPTRRRVDLVNLEEATCDILVAAGVLADDNSGIVSSMDGSRVLYDKDMPRVEILITEADRGGTT